MSLGFILSFYWVFSWFKILYAQFIHYLVKVKIYFVLFYTWFCPALFFGLSGAAWKAESFITCIWCEEFENHGPTELGNPISAAFKSNTSDVLINMNYFGCPLGQYTVLNTLLRSSHTHHFKDLIKGDMKWQDRLWLFYTWRIFIAVAVVASRGAPPEKSQSFALSTNVSLIIYNGCNCCPY